MRLLLLLPLLLASCSTGQRPMVSQPPAHVVAKRQPEAAHAFDHYGVYLKGAKVGWAAIGRWREIVHEGRPALVRETELRLRLQAGGAPILRGSREKQIYEPGSEGRLLFFSAALFGDGGDREMEGRCEGESCELLLRTAGKEELHRLQRPRGPADPILLAAQARKAVEGALFDPIALRFTPMHPRFVRLQPGAVGGQRIAEVKDEAQGQVALVDLDTKTILELRTGALLLSLEPEREARNLGEAPDVLQLTRIPLPSALPEKAAEVTLIVEGLPESLRYESPRQRFEDLGGGRLRVRLSTRAGGAARAPVDRQAFVEELAATGMVDHRDPRIAAIARKLGPATGETLAASAARLTSFVYEHLEKSYGASSDRASEVLASGRGDCTEHSLLLVALARAGGIPARRVFGLVTMEDALYFHEWVELWLGEWVEVDPTLGQLVADATHLRMGTEGDAEGPQLHFEALRVLHAEGG